MFFQGRIQGFGKGTVQATDNQCNNNVAACWMSVKSGKSIMGAKSSKYILS